MSERVRRLVLALVVLGVGTALSAAGRSAAQIPAAETQRLTLEALLDEYRATHRLVDSLGDLKGAQDSVRRAQRAPVSLDTVVVGPYLVVGPDATVARTADLFRRAWAEREQTLGEAWDRLAGTVLHLHSSETRPPEELGDLVERERHHVVRRSGWQGGGRFFGVRVPGRTRHGRLQSAGNELARIPTQLFPPAVIHWLVHGRPGERQGPGAILPPASLAWAEGPEAHARTLAEVHRELAMGTTEVVRLCFRGELASCRLALGLEDPGPDWGGWYSPEELRGMVRARSPQSPTAAHAACVEQGAKDVCLQALELLGGPGPPLGARARASFLRHRLDAAGPGALLRLIEADGLASLREALESSEALPLDLALDKWHEQVMAARSTPYKAAVRVRLTTLFWVILFTALAMRSTRWRLT